MELRDIFDLYDGCGLIEKMSATYASNHNFKYRLQNVAGSQPALYIASLAKSLGVIQVVLISDREDAAYLYNDLTALDTSLRVAFLPSSYRRTINPEERDGDSILVRTEVLDMLRRGTVDILVSFPEAFAERVIDKGELERSSKILKRGDTISITSLEEFLYDSGFERCDFVYEPGQFSIRGGIVDIYSYSEERPVRVEFFGDNIDTIRYFDVETQLSADTIESLSVVPDMSRQDGEYSFTDITSWLPERVCWWLQNGLYFYDKISSLRRENPAPTDQATATESEQLTSSKSRSSKKRNQSTTNASDLEAIAAGGQLSTTTQTPASAEQTPSTADLLTDAQLLITQIERGFVAEWGPDLYFRGAELDLGGEPQPVINKKFDLLADTLRIKVENGCSLYICSTNEMQIARIREIFSDMGYDIPFTAVNGTLHGGFTDKNLNCCIFTEHQIFDRYHKYRLQSATIRKGRESISLNDLKELHPGDYVVHVDHGIGRFGGLTKIDVGGREQEAIRLVYKNNAELYVGLHSLHKISKYKGKDGEVPVVHRLGGEAWNRLKQRTKSRVKDIARELISLYAKRKREPAYAFSKDNYILDEMEASFMYEETPDQAKAIADVKRDMESPRVMDRLICGDVGFGKTEVAMRAAFKAVCDGKQVALLVPTTVLAFQHYNSFKSRLEGLPCRVEYVSRMRKSADIKRVLNELKEGKVDIIIGTHRLTGKDVVFKDLGLLIIDEEQKFGVSVKERLKQLKLNVDTLTMTATPIPRTLQFSLMGARDMSIIRTPPPNRYPIVTELHRFDAELIKEAVQYEVSRNGQIFFIHNRVENIEEVRAMVEKLLPKVKCAVAHGRMKGDELERVMHDFVRGDYDLLIATTIIESGLDIPNANTMIINQAQNYGLSDLHQLRGRVGRSNKKAFCYLLTPPLDVVNVDARRRLKAIEDFSGLGSGFNIAMQDLDIRGAGNILGAEQSGFIAEIGYETYQRILNEAIKELREEEFAGEIGEAAEEAEEERVYVTDCSIESDFEVLIPESYVESVSERIKLYRELDNMRSDEELTSFGEMLRDRFGKIPKPVAGLMRIVKVRRCCAELGVERLVAKGGRMALYFLADQSSPFYASECFARVINFVSKQVVPCSMTQRNEKLILSIPDVSGVERMYEVISSLHKYCRDKK